MKKILSFVLTLFTVAILFAAARPSLDGRALVADSGMMPKGLFARTIGYLPGDSVSVTNPATGSTVDVLILGAIDPSEGVAILLSPEAADALQIKKDSNVQVKITKRSGSLDETVSGTAVLAETSAAPVLEDSVASDTVNTEEVSEGITEEAAEKAALYEEAANPAVEEASEGTGAEELPAEGEEAAEVSETLSEVEAAEETEAVEAVEEEAPAAETEEAAEESLIEEVAPVEETEPVENEKVEEGFVEETPSEKIDEDAPVIEDDTPVESVEEEAPVLEEETAEAETAEEAVPEDAVAEDAAEETAEAPAEAIELDDTFAEETVDSEAEEVVEETAEESVAEESSVEETESADEEAYQPIVIVPTDPKTPYSEEETLALTVEPVKSVKTEVAEEKAVEKTIPASLNFEDHVVSSLKELKPSSYYIQIAALGDRENMEAILSQYGSKYPIVFVPLASGKAYQVMVGPLTVDEYGSVLAKFKAFGFKDAFLRKIR